MGTPGLNMCFVVKPMPLVLAMLVTCTATLAGQWYYQTSKDEMTDEVSSYISTGSADESAFLTLRCDNAGIEVYLQADEYLGDAVSVQYRFDTDPASVPESWRASGRLTVAPAAVVPELTARARSAKKLVVRVDGATTYTFDLDGSLFAVRLAQLSPADRRAMRDSLISFAAAYSKLPCSKASTQAPSIPPIRAEGIDEGFVLGLVPSADQVFLEAVVEERPERLTGPAPQYPELLRQAGVSGRVLVQAVIDTIGRAIPSTVRIVQSAHAGFDDAARRVILQSLFRPGRVGGRAVKVLMSLPVYFGLEPRDSGRGYIQPAVMRGLVMAPACVRGQVTVHFSVEGDGSVSKIEVAPPLTDAGCQRQLLARMRLYKFAPALTRDGHPVASVVSVVIAR